MIGIPSSALHGQGQFNGLGFSTTAKVVATSLGLNLVSFADMLSFIRHGF